MKLEALAVLFRPKPVVAWSVSSVVVALASAIHDNATVSLTYFIVGLAVLLILQGITSHATNDLVDREVDREAELKKTNRRKVLVEGLANDRELLTVASTSLALTTILVYIISYIEHDYTILALYLVGVLIIYAYNCWPLKLSYKPFGEFTVVLPTIFFMVLGARYLMTGDFGSSVYLAIPLAMINSAWYILSRAQDVCADEKAGKITTAVFVRQVTGVLPDSMWLFEYIHTYYFLVGIAYTLLLIFATVIVDPSISVYYFVGAMFIWTAYSMSAATFKKYTDYLKSPSIDETRTSMEEAYAICRVRSIHLTFLMAVIFLVVSGYSLL